MIAIDLEFRQWQWQYQISTTFFIGVIVPVLYYVYNKYITAQPNNYNKIEAPVKITLPIPEEARPH